MQVKYLTPFFAIYLLFSCTNTKYNKEEISSEEAYLFRSLSIIDSFKVSSNSMLTLTDYSEERKEYLFFDLYNQGVVITDNLGNLRYSWSKNGIDPESYNEIRGASFISNAQIVIVSTWSYHIYNLDGTFIKAGKFGNDILGLPMANLEVVNYLNKDGEEIIAIKGSTYNSAKFTNNQLDLSYKWVTLYNLTTDEVISSGVPYEAEMYKEYRFPAGSTPEFFVDETESLLYALFPLEPLIYKYELPTLELKEKVEISPKYFSKPEGIPYKGNNNPDFARLFQLEQLNAKYNATFFLGNATLLTYYQTGINESKLVTSRDKLDSKRDRKRYIQVINTNGQALSNDILLPQSTFLNYASSRNHIVLRKIYDVELPYAMYYIAQLDEI